VVIAKVVVVLIFRMWDLNFGTWISHSGLHMIQEARNFTVSEGHGHPLGNRNKSAPLCLTFSG